MKIPFYKMHGAGNDFIVVDDRELLFPAANRSFIEQVAARRTGIGCDGVILLQPSAAADLRMRFLNPDGNEVEMCGNGARCFARLACDLGAAPAEMQIETAAGLVHAWVEGAEVRLELPPPSDWKLGLDAGLERPVDFVNTGVPHAVLRVDDLAAVDLPQVGRTLRCHELFAPEGANANFVRVDEDATLSVRTYERGVEGETLACGTGAAAVALVAARHGWIELPVVVHCAGGYGLTIDSCAGKTTLTGSAEYVFEGEMEYGSRV